jgi:transporter family-2 protein
MYRNLALLNGALLAVMLFVNGMTASMIGVYTGTLLFHLAGLLLIIIIIAVKRNKFIRWNEMKPVFFLPGILSVITILLNNLCVPELGVTLTIGISLYGQLIMSGLVEHFGLFGMPQNRFRKEKVLGFSIISLGIFLMITV